MVGKNSKEIKTEIHFDRLIGFYSFNTNEPKTIIENCNLRYSVLHFQIFLVDENQIAYPTDLLCETARIFEYEGRIVFTYHYTYSSKFFQPTSVRIFNRLLCLNENIRKNVYNRNRLR
jgi:hypothetical protein